MEQLIVFKSKEALDYALENWLRMPRIRGGLSLKIPGVRFPFLPLLSRTIPGSFTHPMLRL